MLLLAKLFIVSFYIAVFLQDTSIAKDFEALLERCSNDTTAYKYEKYVDLEELQFITKIVVTLVDQQKAQSGDIRVFIGRIIPKCDINLRTYKQCFYSKNYHTFDCPRDEPFARIVVQSKLKILEVKETTISPPRVDLGDILSSVKATADFRRKAVKELSQGVSTLNIFKWPSALQFISPYSLQIGINPSDNKVFFGAVATGDRGEGGKIVVANDMEEANNLISNLPLFNNLANWMTNGVVQDIRDAEVVSPSLFSNSKTISYSLLIWYTHVYQLTPEQLRILSVLVQERGIGLIVFVNSWYYNRDVEPLHRSNLYAFLKQFGVILTLDYLNIPSNKEQKLDWNTVEKTSSAIEKLELISKDIREFKESMEKWLDNQPYKLDVFDKYFVEIYRNYFPLLELDLPCRFKDTRDPEKIKIIRVFNLLFNKVYYKHPNLHVPAVFIYPGDVKDKAPLLTATVRHFCEAGGGEISPTGYYVPPGKTLIAKLVGRSSDISWKVWINYNLFDVYTKDYYYKFPITYAGPNSRSNEEVELFTAFGGLVFIQCFTRGDIIDVELKNVIQAPLLDAGSTESIEDWSKRRLAPAPWTSLHTDSIFFTTTTRSIINEKELVEALDMHDRCNKYQMHIAGDDFNNLKREFVSFDAQTRSSWMHSGYPVGIYLTSVEPGYVWSPFNATHMRTHGSWGLYHELGHNRQKKLWTSSVTSQVTNNLFTLACQELLAKQAIWVVDSLWHTEYDYLNTLYIPYLRKELSGKNLEWGLSPWTTIGVYVQLQDNFGWEFYKQYFRSYQDLTDADKAEIKAGGDQKVHDVWFMQSCKISSYNLAPLFIFWRVPISERVLLMFDNLPAFFPDDFVTKAVPEVTSEILNKFPGVTRVAKPITERVGPFNYQAKTRNPMIKVLSEQETGKFVLPINYGFCRNRFF